MNTLSYKLFGDTELLPLLLTCAAACLVIWLFFHFAPIHWKQAEQDPAPYSGKLSFLRRSRSRTVFEKKDWIAVTVLTVLYAIVSFWQLGGTSFPSTTWQPSSDSEYIILELTEDTHFDSVYAIYGEGDNNSNPDAYQLGFHKIQITGSNDLTSWDLITELDNGSIYQYLITQGDWDYKYIGITSSNKSDTLSEIAFKAYGEDRLLSVSVQTDSAPDSAYPAELVIDEQDKVALHPTYMDESYFDEVYHPRNAWEIANGEYMYASVHPLLGTCLIALSIKIFGMNPLAWRLPGAIFGVLMVPLFYYILKMIFRKHPWAELGTLYFVTDFMHLTTSRIGTLEPFSVFFILLMFSFMIRYYYSSFYDTPRKKTLIWLLLCGISMGLGIATKWTACYSAVGLAILLFANWIRRGWEYRKACHILKTPEEAASLSKEELQICRRVKKKFRSTLTLSVAWCFIFFIFIPIIIYWVSYIPTKVWRDGYSIENVWSQIQYMYHYHTNLKATHPYQSSWYQWILDIRPIWYYNGTDVNGYAHSISCFSNPIVCWGGFLAVLYTIVDTIRTKDRTGFLILVGYLTALIPWVLLVKRCVFAYHFYPSSLFMIMALVHAQRKLALKHPRMHTWILIFAAASIIAFLAFLPATAGFGTSYSYIHALEWFPSWYFG